MLDKLEEAGYPKSDLLTLQQLVDMEKSDLYDVLEYIFNGDYIALTREARAKAAEATIFALLNDKQKKFISFVLSKYIESGVEELDQREASNFTHQQIPNFGRCQGNIGKCE